MPYISLFVIICGVIGLLIGLWRGARRKLSAIIAITLSVLTSMLITQPILKAILTEGTIKVIVEKTSFAVKYNELISISPSVADLVQGIPIAIVAPIIFLIF